MKQKCGQGFSLYIPKYPIPSMDDKPEEPMTEGAADSTKYQDGNIHFNPDPHGRRIKRAIFEIQYKTYIKPEVQ